MNKFRDRFIRAHGFLYIVRGVPGNYMIFTGRKRVETTTPVTNAKRVREVIRYDSIRRLRACLTT